jgi:hypothetical protein
VFKQQGRRELLDLTNGNLTNQGNLPNQQIKREILDAIDRALRRAICSVSGHVGLTKPQNNSCERQNE